MTCHVHFRTFICALYVCGRNLTHFSLVAFLCIITLVCSLFWHRSFVWIYKNFSSCCWRLSCVFVRTAFVVGKVGDYCPKVIHTGVSWSLECKDCTRLVGCILCSESTLGFLFYYYLFSFFAYRKAVNYYELLGVKSNANLDEIKNAFFEKSKKVRSLFPSIHSTFK